VREVLVILGHSDCKGMNSRNVRIVDIYDIGRHKYLHPMDLFELFPSNRIVVQDTIHIDWHHWDI